MRPRHEHEGEGEMVKLYEDETEGQKATRWAREQLAKPAHPGVVLRVEDQNPNPLTTKQREQKKKLRKIQKQSRKANRK